MEYRKLGRSGLKISEIGLGCNNFGSRVDEQSSISIIRHALELGVNYIDTADWYSQRGRSEECVGKALKGKRSDAIIATKFGFAMGEGPNEHGGSRYHIMRAVDASLKRLDTDYIDLYQFHRPDPTTPIEETLQTLDNLVRAGKVRYIGCSNFAAWQLCEALWTSRANGLESFVTVQSRYNLLNRTIEQELVPCCQTYGVGVIPWGPLAGGFLTGKYQRAEAAPDGTRLSRIGIYGRMFNDATFDKLDRLKAFAEERGHSVAELAIAWLLSHPWLSTVIAGASQIEQVTTNVAAAEWKLTSEDTGLLLQTLGDESDAIVWGDMGGPRRRRQ